MWALNYLLVGCKTFKQMPNRAGAAGLKTLFANLDEIQGSIREGIVDTLAQVAQDSASTLP